MTGLKIFIAGIVATLVMTGALKAISGPNAYLNPVHVIGSRRDGDLSHSGMRGEIIHLIFGVAFAFFYYGLLAIYGAEISVLATVATCVAIGFSHGLFAGFLFGVLVIRWHPRRQVQRSMPALVAVYLIVHVIYGFAIGLGFVLLDVDFRNAALGGVLYTVRDGFAFIQTQGDSFVRDG